MLSLQQSCAKLSFYQAELRSEKCCKIVSQSVWERTETHTHMSVYTYKYIYIKIQNLYKNVNVILCKKKFMLMFD